MENTNNRVIKDSGSTTEFSTGAHRDARTGKGRIDLIPLEVASKLMDEDPILKNVREFQKDENTDHLYEALKHFCVTYYDGVTETIHKGETKTIERGVNHSFSSANGCVFEEISTTHYPNDSFYENQRAFVTPRKTEIYLTKHWASSTKTLPFQ